MRSADLVPDIRGHEKKAKKDSDSLVGSCLVLPEIHTKDCPIDGI